MASVDMSAGGGRRSGHHPGRPRPRRDGRSRGFAPAARRAALDSQLDAASASVAGLVAASGALLVLRRSSGVASIPSGIAPLVATAVVGIVVVAAIDRIAARRSWPRWLSRAGLALAVAALMPPVASFGGPGLGPLDGLIALLSVAGASAVLVAPGARPRRAQRRHRRGRPRPDGHPGAQRGPGRTTSPPAVRVPAPSPVEQVIAAPAPPNAPGPGAGLAGTALPPHAGRLQQRFERFAIPADGIECQRGTLLLSVAPGSRSAAGHVGFCPPFPALPQVEVGTTSEEIEATIVAAEILPWGVRVECRLDEPADEAIDIPVTLVARAPLTPSPPPRR